MGASRYSPLLRVAVALILGVTVFLYTGKWQGPGYALFTMMLLIMVSRFTFLFSSYSYRWLPGIAIYGSLMLGGYFLAANYSQVEPERDHIDHLHDHPAVMVLKMAASPEIKGRYVRIKVKIIGILDSSGCMKPQELNCLAYFRADSNMSLPGRGRILIGRVKIKPIEGPMNPNEFDFRRYMAGKNISVKAFLEPGEWKVIGQERVRLFDWAEKCKGYLVHKFSISGLDPASLALISSLLLGEKDGLEKDLKDSFSAAGAMHILCVSGLHVGILFIVFNSLLKTLIRMKYGNLTRALLVVIVIWFYAILTGLSPSVTRASMMFSLLQAGKLMRNPPPTINTLAGSAVILVMINPLVITQVGFQFSYLAVMAIVLIAPHLQSLWTPSNRALGSTWGLIVISLAAQVGTGPLAVHYFHTFPAYFLLTNLIVIPLATVIIYASLVILVVPFEMIFMPLAQSLTYLLHLLAGSVRWVENLPGSVIDDISIPTVTTVLVYILFWMVIRLIQSRTRKYLFLSLLTVTALLVLVNIKTIDAEKNKEVCIYHIRDHSVMDFISGKRCISFTDTDSLPDRILSYSIDPNRIANSIVDIKSRNIHLLELLNDKDVLFFNGGFIGFAGTRMYMTGMEEIPGNIDPILVELLVITGQYPGSALELITKVRADEVVIDGSNPPWKAEKYRAICDSMHISCHITSQEGAYVFKIR